MAQQDWKHLRAQGKWGEENEILQWSSNLGILMMTLKAARMELHSTLESDSKSLGGGR